MSTAVTVLSWGAASRRRRRGHRTTGVGRPVALGLNNADLPNEVAREEAADGPRAMGAAAVDLIRSRGDASLKKPAVPLLES
jgi:hypothetical protein